MSAVDDFDRLVASWLETAGPADMSADARDAAFALARRTERRGRVAAVVVGPAPWPPARRGVLPGGLTRRASVRLLLVAIIAALLVGTTLLVAGGLRDARPGIPWVEDLGTFTTAQLSMFGSTRLNDGRVLLVGGVDTTGGQAKSVAGAWVFDPANGMRPAGAMGTARTDPLVVTLTDGRALIIGGWQQEASGSQTQLQTAELYDPATGTLSPTAPLPDARSECPCGALNLVPFAQLRATTLPDGRVFVSGGSVDPGRGSGATMADLFDPATERWSQLDIGCDAARGTQTLLPDGRLLVVCVRRTGSGGATVENRARLFDPSSNTFTEAARPPAAGSSTPLHAVWASTNLPDGRVLFTGVSSAVYDPSSDSVDPVRTLGHRLPQAGFALADGRILFLNTGDPGGPGLRFDPATLSFEEVPQPGLDAADATVQLRDGRILTVGYQLETRLLDPERLP